MEGLRMSAYRTFDWPLLKQHGRACILCWLFCLPWLWLLPGGTARLAGAVLAGFLSVLAVFDAHYGLLYDRILLPLAVIGLVLEALGFLEAGWADSCLAAGTAGLFFCLLRFSSGGGVGWGDIKLAAAIGLWLGIRGTAAAVALAIVLGGFAACIMLTRGYEGKDALPFGPFLSVGAYAAYILGDSLWNWYWEMLL